VAPAPLTFKIFASLEKARLEKHLHLFSYRPRRLIEGPPANLYKGYADVFGALNSGPCPPVGKTVPAIATGTTGPVEMHDVHGNAR
jgi:hypothetical protein